MKNFKIDSVKVKEIPDSRGKKTIKIELNAGLGKFSASVPSGTSKGKYEAVEKPAAIAADSVNKIIAPKIKGRNPVKQKKIDEFLIAIDGTKKKSRLGANAILGISMAVCRAGAKEKKMPLWKWISKIAGTRPKLPRPSLLQFEGGKHGRTSLDIQEFMTVASGRTFKERLSAGIKTYKSLGKSFTDLGLEGAFVPRNKKTNELLELLTEKSGKSKIFIDAAANSFYKKGKYYFEGKKLTAKELLSFYLDIIKKYPIIAIEDPFVEEDWKSWQRFMLELKKQKLKVMVVGDDLTVTNSVRIKLAKKRKACNAVIIKLNQIGTVSEAIEAAKLAKSFGWEIIISHRSGETMDDFIADLAVGLGADFIKSGAPSKPERMAKYNRLLKIEKEMS